MGVKSLFQGGICTHMLLTIAKIVKQLRYPSKDPDKENVMYIYTGTLFSLKKIGSPVIYNHMD